MDRNLSAVFNSINEEFGDNISPGSRYYMEVNIGERARSMGFRKTGDAYSAVEAIIPLKHPVSGMKVRIDGRTFVNYAQYDTGIVVPGRIARAAGLRSKPYVPHDSMILNFN